MQKDNLKTIPFNAGIAKMVEGSDKVRAQRCAQEIGVILSSYDCEMVPEVVISGNGFSSNIKVIAKPRNLSS